MAGSILALSVKPCRACQLSQGESPWHSGIVSGSSAEFVVSPEPLPLGELDLRSKDGEDEDACLRTNPLSLATARQLPRGGSLWHGGKVLG